MSRTKAKRELNTPPTRIRSAHSMKFFLNGEWQHRDEVIEIRNPFDGNVIDTVPKATTDEVDAALASAASGAKTMSATTGYERFELLHRTAQLIRDRTEELAQTISAEAGKPISEARIEVGRASQTMELSGEEAKRLGGEVLPLDGGQGVRAKLGFTLRVPCGIVVAISPFNFPLNLVCHKIGPALAAGNAVVLKPASDTPLSALKLVEILLEAGMPPMALSCLTGGGGTIGRQLCADPRVRKITFTGSREVGEDICQTAGLKKVTMELGSNCPLIVLPDADLDQVTDAIALSGYANAGQVCISTQRVITQQSIHDELMAKLIPKIAALNAGDQLRDETKVGPMIRETDAARVENWLQEAVKQGGSLACGGERDGTLVKPALVDNANEDMKLCQEELFGPAVAVMNATDVNQAIALANTSDYGLGAGIFTQDIDAAMQFAQAVQSGNIHINSSAMWRADLMPYGGLKGSGMGKEGPKYAVAEMTESKTVVIHSKPVP